MGFGLIGGGTKKKAPAPAPLPRMPYVWQPPPDSIVGNQDYGGQWPNPAGQGPGGGGGGGGGDQNILQTNPDLAQYELLAGRDRTRLAGDYWSNIMQLLLGYGSKTLAEQYAQKAMGQVSPYLGYTPSLDWINTVSDNPDTSFSTLGQLGRNTARATVNTREGVNNQNLFFAGHGAQAMGDQNYANQKAYSTAAQDVNSRLEGAASNYLSGLSSIDWQLASAAQGAYSAELGQGYKYPTTPSADTPAIEDKAPAQVPSNPALALQNRFAPGNSPLGLGPGSFGPGVTPGRPIGSPAPHVYPQRRKKRQYPYGGGPL